MTGESALRVAEVDVGAIARNVERIRAVSGARVVVVVKAGGYGHGAERVARAALAGGAAAIATADVREALALREAGVDGTLLCWLHGDGADFAEAVAAGIELGIADPSLLAPAIAAGAAVHLKLETGLARNGVAPADRDAVFRAAAAAEHEGGFRVAGLMTHLSNTSREDDLAALAEFDAAVAGARAAGLDPGWLHAAATAAAFDVPEARYDTVRVGLGALGLSPFDDRSSADLGLTPAMTLRSRVAAVRDVDAGHGVSYGYVHRTAAPTRLALVPLGYADGIPRQASGLASVLVGGRLVPQVGRIAMDQFVVDVGPGGAELGDEVVVFGDPAAGHPPVEALAESAGTINYDVVTRIGPRVARVTTGAP